MTPLQILNSVKLSDIYCGIWANHDFTDSSFAMYVYQARGPMDSTASRSLLASVEAGNMVKQTAVTVKAEANRTANHTTAFR